MDWEKSRRSNNVEDRRRSRVSAPVVGGGIGTIVIALIVAFLGGDPSVVLDQGGAPSNPTGAPQTTAQDDQMVDFVEAVLGDTENTWHDIFAQSGETYVEPKLVLFSEAVQSGCGVAQSSVGPFYCPRDQTVYIDLEFYRELRNRFQAPGDFAQAYVIAHEVGHHVQNLTGISSQVQSLQRRVGEAEANQLSVRLELQADCYAGVWDHHADRSRQLLEQGDIEEAINAASAIGDDRLQSQARGYVDPESFTHGSSEQRVRWFTKGLQTGDLSQCDTFSTRSLQ
ncbi:MAG: zinc metallopeptidase [Microcoleus sp. SIO2G3]|nr:zinc metallopeptidase [Microcoleus sp. SIO2G3]